MLSGRHEDLQLHGIKDPASTAKGLWTNSIRLRVKEFLNQTLSVVVEKPFAGKVRQKITGSRMIFN